MGGSKSEEFLAPCPTGEDTYVLCEKCGYAANVEAMVTKVAPYAGAAPAAMEIFDSPNTPTIDSLVDLLNKKFGGGYAADQTLKNVMIMADEKAISVLVPGDREVDLKRLGANLSGVSELRLFEDGDFVKFPGLVKGYIGPQDAKNFGITIYADPRVTPGSHWVTGANQKDKHVRFVTNGRDFEVDAYLEAAEVRAGDLCPSCQSPVIIDRAIEIGHIFQLGRKYAQALDLTVLDQNGKSQVVTMGSYGIGVSRAVAAIAEQTHDEIGLNWPREIAPADVHIVATGKDELIFETAEKLALDLEAEGLRVMFDDRKDPSAGVKFKDAELIGIPFIVIVGKALAEGKVELRIRSSGEKSEINAATATEDIYKVVTA
jgi:prolyl-tRNA synthetase